jgi:glutamine amidotransferase
MRLTIFDYGAGNLHSLLKAVQLPGANVGVETDPLRCLDTDLLLLPGVGGFSQAASRLAPARRALRDALRDGLPAIGICLGMQLLFEHSEEGMGTGLGLFDGSVTRLRAARVPHIGWNSVEVDGSPDWLLDANPLPTAYFANGYACRPDDTSFVTAWTQHEDDRFPAVVRVARTLGVQFHPEKSSTAGVQLLRAAIAEAAR